MNIERLTPALIIATLPFAGCQQPRDIGPTASPTAAPSDAREPIAAASTKYIAAPHDEVNEIESDPSEYDPTSVVRRTDGLYTEVEVFVDPTLRDACGIEQPKLHFELDSAEVQDRGDRAMQMLANCLNRHPLEEDPLRITGYADPRGSEAYNRSLGLDRAKAVARELTAHGVSAQRIDTYSWGEAKASDDPDEWPTNRKVVVKLDR